MINAKNKNKKKIPNIEAEHNEEEINKRLK
jgi:hypothetical protein